MSHLDPCCPTPMLTTKGVVYLRTMWDVDIVVCVVVLCL